MSVVRPWFIGRMDHFKEQRTSTPVGDESYVTVGRLVPIETVLRDMPDVLKFEKTANGWQDSRLSEPGSAGVVL